MHCRFCKAKLEHVFIDLFNSPASNSFLTEAALNEPEVYFPLKVYTCSSCFLVQIDEYKKSSAIFDSNYVYFSSYSTSWLAHSKQYVQMMIQRFGFNEQSLVIEVASNDGYLLQYFKANNIPVLGIEPTANTAKVSMEKGIENIVDFFGVGLAEKLANEGRKPDLLLGNNVLAHVPDIVDFVKGMKIILKSNGVITMEFPHLLQLMENNQFDTIYHEHFSYLSFLAVKRIFEAQGLSIFDVEEIPTHGGSLRIFACHTEEASKRMSENVGNMLLKEEEYGLNQITTYSNFQEQAFSVKMNFLSFLLEQKRNGKKVVGYGAAAKGNTLLNYCGVKNDLISYVVDANPHKQFKWLPASHIPVLTEAHLKNDKPDYVIIFPWNIKEEVMAQLKYIKAWNGKFVIPIPQLEIL